MTPPPRFPQAAPFSTQSAPASAKQHASMVRIPGGAYTIGSPAQHPLANRAALPAHRVTINPFRIDRTEVTNAQFAEFMNALPVKPIGTALGGKVTPANIAPADRPLFLEFSSRPKGATPEGLLDMAGSLLEWTSTLDRPYPYRADDGREDPNLPGERIVRGGNYIFDDTPDKRVSWNRSVAFRNPATGHRQIGFRCAAD